MLILGRRISTSPTAWKAECRLKGPKKKPAGARGRRSATVDRMKRFAETFLGQAFNGRIHMLKDCCYQSCGIHYYMEEASQPQEENARNW